MTTLQTIYNHYMATISGSVTDLFAEIHKKGWNLHKTDREALLKFDRIARDYSNAPPGTLDYIINEVDGGDAVRVAVQLACTLLDRTSSGVLSPDLVAHNLGCPIIIIEKKTVEKIKPRRTSKGLMQLRSLYQIYAELHEKGIAHKWLEQSADYLPQNPISFDDSEFRKYRGLALLHINHVDSHIKQKLLHNLVVSNTPSKMAGRVALERNPYIIVVKNLRSQITKQITFE